MPSSHGLLGTNSPMSGRRLDEVLHERADAGRVERDLRERAVDQRELRRDVAEVQVVQHGDVERAERVPHGVELRELRRVRR